MWEEAQVEQEVEDQAWDPMGTEQRRVGSVSVAIPRVEAMLVN